MNDRNQTVLVASYVEDDVVAYGISILKYLPHIEEVALPCMSRDSRPRPQLVRGLGVALAGFHQALAGDEIHGRRLWLPYDALHFAKSSSQRLRAYRTPAGSRSLAGAYSTM